MDYSRPRRLGTVAVLTLLASAASATTPTIARFSGPIPGAVEISELGTPLERVQLPAGLIELLTETPVDATVEVEAWPTAPGVRLPVAITRHQVTAPGARLLAVSPNGSRELGRTRRLHFWGAPEPDGRILLSVDPVTRTIRGFTSLDGTTFDLAPAGEGSAVHTVIATAERLDALASRSPSWTCGVDTTGFKYSSVPVGPIDTVEAPRDPEILTTHTATIAVDTDTELLDLKINDNTTAALDYIADLFAAMNVMYERDLGVRLLQGDTILRVTSDPYVQNSGGAASPAELNEFGSYWASHYGHFDRALAAMLSGKSPNPYGASGIAWVSGLCSHSIGYSFTKVFLIDYLAGDASVVGHELGHNFGSRHTHCYTPPIDTCYSGEGGCYTGPTSCPGGPGTVMSYCHIAGCGNNLMQFHNRVITNLTNNHVNPAIGVCIFETGNPQPLFDDGFESGDTSTWSATQF